MKALRTLVLLALTLALLIAWGIVWQSILVHKHSSEATEEWAGHLTAVLALAGFTGLIGVLGRSATDLIVGKDNRVSTSKLQVFVWTYALGGALLSLVVANWAGATAGYNSLVNHQLQTEYLILLGGPFAAAVAAKAIVTSKVENGDITKTDGTPGLSQAVTADDGSTDLVDTQYLLFNLIALILFIGKFVTETGKGLPNIPDLVVGLTGAAAAGYISNKAILRAKPLLVSVVPATASPGAHVEVFAQYLLTPKPDAQAVAPPDAPLSSPPAMSPPGALSSPPAAPPPGAVSFPGQAAFEPVHLTFGGVEATVSSLTHGTAGDDKVTVVVPTGQSGDVKLQAFTFKGIPSNELDFVVAAPGVRG